MSNKFLYNYNTENCQVQLKESPNIFYNVLLDYSKNTDCISNYLFYGDNYDILSNILLESTLTLGENFAGRIKLVYIDPPYSTGRNILDINNNIAYQDKLTGDRYIKFLKQRILLLWEILEPNGSIFIHLNSNTSHYVKVFMDSTFGRDKFVNEIIWQNTNSSKTTKCNLARNYQSILWYSKGRIYTFNPIYEELAESTKRKYNRIDEYGRGFYRLAPLQKISLPSNDDMFNYVDNNGKVWPPPPKGWLYCFDKLKELENDNRLYLENNKLYVKVFWNEHNNLGKMIGNLWTDIPNLQGTNHEYTGYPTQKPEKLMQRLIELCTNENDIILDAFLGSGTTICTAEKLNRRWIGIDNSMNAIKTTLNRLININYTRDLRHPKELYAKDLGRFKIISLNSPESLEFI